MTEVVIIYALVWLHTGVVDFPCFIVFYFNDPYILKCSFFVQTDAYNYVVHAHYKIFLKTYSKFQKYNTHIGLNI